MNEKFPVDPFVVLGPEVRWYPRDRQEMFTEDGYSELLAPVVHKIRNRGLVR